MSGILTGILEELRCRLLLRQNSVWKNLSRLFFAKSIFKKMNGLTLKYYTSFENGFGKTVFFDFYI